MRELVIGICDDQTEVIHTLQKYIINICEANNYKWKVLGFTSGYKLLEAINMIDLVFLDIEMEELDGIEVGKRIKKANPFCKIIMETGRVERFKEAFHIQAFRFVTKPFDIAEIEEAIKSVVDADVGSDRIELSYQREKYVVQQREIRYVQSFNGYSEVLIGKTIMRKEMSLNDIEQLLDSRIFVRIHRQFIVNLCWIDTYKKNIVYIQDKKIPVARRKQKHFEEKYVEYDIHYR